MLYDKRGKKKGNIVNYYKTAGKLDLNSVMPVSINLAVM